MDLFAYLSDTQDSKSTVLKKSLEPTGQIAALLLTGSCFIQSESGSVPCVHCSPFGKLNREVKATSGVTDNRRPYTSCFMSREG